MQIVLENGKHELKQLKKRALKRVRKNSDGKKMYKIKLYALKKGKQMCERKRLIRSQNN